MCFSKVDTEKARFRSSLALTDSELTGTARGAEDDVAEANH